MAACAEECLGIARSCKGISVLAGTCTLYMLPRNVGDDDYLQEDKFTSPIGRLRLCAVGMLHRFHVPQSNIRGTNVDLLQTFAMT